MRELPILTNCGVSSFSNSALFKLRERRFSLRIRVIFSCSEREMTQLHILTRLDAEQHLRYEPSERLCQALTELRGKLRQLRFESGSNFAIVHRGTPPWWFGFLVKTLLPRISSPPTSQSRQATDLSRVRLSVLQILGKLLANCLDSPAARPSGCAVFSELLEPYGSGHCRTRPRMRKTNHPAPHPAVSTGSPRPGLRRHQFLHPHQYPHPCRTSAARA